MAIWKEPALSTKEPVAAIKDTTTLVPEAPVKTELEHKADVASAPAVRRPAPVEMKESVIGGDITITGKIDGAGHVRLAGRFEGDVHIQGDLTVEPGARLTGSVRAKSVTLGGEIEGNIEGAERVELLATGVLNGDLNAATLTVASGSRMRGRVEFGWADEPSSKGKLTLGTRQVS